MTTEEMLALKYGPVLSTDDIAQVLKYENAKVVANAHSAGRLPFETFRRGKRRLAHVSDVARYIDSLRPACGQRPSA